MDTTRFNATLRQIADRSHRSGTDLVRSWAKRLVQKAAFRTPIESGRHPHQARGRARAGFWPAGAALGVVNLYTPYPNRGEGTADDRTESMNPTFRFTNDVPYITLIPPGGESYFQQAVDEVQSRMARELEDTFKKEVLTNVGG